MPEHSPAAVLARDCPRCVEMLPHLKLPPMTNAATWVQHNDALRDAYLAERARVAEVVAAVDAIRLDVEHSRSVRDEDPTIMRRDGFPADVGALLRDALATFRSES